MKRMQEQAQAGIENIYAKDVARTYRELEDKKQKEEAEVADNLAREATEQIEKDRLDQDNSFSSPA